MEEGLLQYNNYNSPDYSEIKYNKEKNILLDNYIIIKKLGSGSFGEVYLAKHRQGGYIAAKVENNKKISRLDSEYKIYKCLNRRNNVIGIPKIYEYVKTPQYNILFMQLLGPSLEDLFNKCDRKFKLETVMLLSTQLIELLEYIHSNNYVHRDIKPNNFMIGRTKNINQIYVLDFGLSKKYNVNNNHISFKEGRSLIGTARYASINMHNGYEPSRRDDLESIGYMLIYFLCGGKLPWQGLVRVKGESHIEQIGDVKMCTNINSLCRGLPSCFSDYIMYCRQLKFKEKPDYNYLKLLFKNDCIKYNIKPSYNEFINLL
jgi:serine/threonine protein kinase